METAKEEKKKIGQKKPETKKRYLVKTKGYRETFDTMEKARNQYEILKKKAIKSQQKVRIQILELDKNSQNLVDEVNVTEQFFQE